MTAQPISRYDIYRLIHKGLRAHMCDVLTALGRVDFDDQVEVAAVLKELRGLLAFCRTHLEHENDYVHTAMEKHAGSSSAKVAQEHVEHQESIRDLERYVDVIETASGSAREVTGMRLYQELSQFVAENFVHMLIEERDHNVVLWEHYRDDQIMAIEHAIVSSLSPQDHMMSLRLMLTAASPKEKLAILQKVKAAAPAEAFNGIVAMVEPMLSTAQQRKLRAGLGLAAA